MTTPSNRPLGLRLRTLGEGFLGLGLVTDAATGLLLSRTPALSDPLASVESLAAQTLLSSLLLVVLIGFLSHQAGESLKSLFLGRVASVRREVLRGLVLVPAIFLGSFLVKSSLRHLAPGLYHGDRNVLEDLMRTPTDLAIFLVVAVLAGGVREEIQRAYMIRCFERGWGPAWLGAALYALYFGFAHRVQGWDEAIIAGLIGLVWGGVYVIRRNCIGNSVSHGLYDVLELIRYYAWGPLRTW